MKQFNKLNSKTLTRKFVMTGIILAGGMVGTVQAASLLASGPVFGASQNHVACQVANLGATPITFLTKQFVSQSNSNLPKNFDNCLGSLAPNAICTFQATVGNVAVSCKVVIAEAKTNVRGTMTALTSTNAQVSEADLR